MTCRNCGASDISNDNDDGSSVCTSCGTVQDETTVFESRVQFAENAYGTSSVTGSKFVSSESRGGTSLTNNRGHGGALESRERTQKNARVKITAVASHLKLNEHCINVACNFYNMALRQNLTYGRKIMNVIGACAYITCRLEGTGHLLIDIADVLDIDVYRLGHTYMQLCNALFIKTPLVEPCLYVLRFASQMGFGDKTQRVSTTALRIVQRMKRDWMTTGRRPSGLCGAALLIAARMHGFNRCVRDMVKQVKIHEVTVRKRLVEFAKTPTSQLSLDDFMTVDLAEEQDPPAFSKSREADRQQLDKMTERDNRELVKLQEQIDRQLAAEFPAKLRGPWAKYAQEATLKTTGQQSSREDQVTDAFIADRTISVIQQCMQQVPDQNLTYLQLQEHLRPSLHSLGISDAQQAQRSKDDQPQKNMDELQDGELDLTGIDDHEIDGYLQSEEQVALKTKQWMESNAEFVTQQEQKEKRKAEEAEEKLRKGGGKSKSNRKHKQSNNASTPGEAIGKMLAARKLSTKINYDALKSLGIVAGTLDSSVSVGTCEEATRPEAARAARIEMPPSPPPAPVVVEEDKEEEQFVDEEQEFDDDEDELSNDDLLSFFRRSGSDYEYEESW